MSSKLRQASRDAAANNSPQARSGPTDEAGVLEQTAMNYRMHPPPEPLSDYVEHLWTVEADDDGPPDLTLKFFVTTAPCIVFQHRDGRSAIVRRIPDSGGEACDGHHPTSFVRGAITRPFQCLTQGAPTAIGVELKPQALNTLLGIDAAELTDGMVDLDAFSGEDLNERLLNSGSQHDRIDVVTRFLERRAVAPRRVDSIVAESLNLIQRHPGSLRIRQVLRRVRLSERQFERRFRRAVGVPPSLYLRIIRFQEAVKLMKAGRSGRLSDVAADLGYSDQSHFIKDVREFTGQTPKSLAGAVDECIRTSRYRALVRQRILIQQNGR